MFCLPQIHNMPYGTPGMGHRWLIGTIVTLNLCATAISADPVVRRTGAPWPDTLLARVEALALIETLNAKLLGAHTATEVLATWCADHKMASNPLVHARRITGVEKPLSDEQRQRLSSNRRNTSPTAMLSLFAATMSWSKLTIGMCQTG